MPDTPSRKSPSSAQLRFDWQDWLPYLEGESPESDKRALIEALWSIVTAFVDLGWEVTGSATGAETCGQPIDLKAALQAAVVNSQDHQTEKEEV